MREAGQTVEGVPTATTAARLRDQLVADGAVARDDFPLLAAIEELLTDPAVARGARAADDRRVLTAVSARTPRLPVSRR